MDRISIKTLIKNSKEGRISREAYIDELVRQLNKMPSEHLYGRQRDSEGKIHFSFKHLDNILRTLGIPVEESGSHSFHSLLWHTARHLECGDTSNRDVALEVVDYYFKLARDIDSTRIERRLQP